MTSMDHIEHALGIVAIGVFGWGGYTAAASIARDVDRNLDRILAALRGEPISPAASDTPLASASLPQRRGVEAAAAPAIQVGR